MLRVIIPEKSKLINEITSSDKLDIIFKISPQKKAHLEAIVSNRGNKVTKVLREWMDKDKLLFERIMEKK
jgi:hypothetical protein